MLRSGVAGVGRLALGAARRRVAARAFATAPQALDYAPEAAAPDIAPSETGTKLKEMKFEGDVSC